MIGQGAVVDVNLNFPSIDNPKEKFCAVASRSEFRQHSRTSSIVIVVVCS